MGWCSDSSILGVCGRGRLRLRRFDLGFSSLLPLAVVGLGSRNFSSELQSPGFPTSLLLGRCERGLAQFF